MLASLNNIVTGDSAKALVNENTKPLPTPLSITLYRGITFPDDGVTFRATASYGGKPWFDFGWVRVGRNERGSEPDHFDPNPKENHRQLVKFWAFAEVEGEKYALVDYFQKVKPPPTPRSAGGRAAADNSYWAHPVLKEYEHVPYTDKDKKAVPPFYAVPVASIIGAACVFPCVDQGRDLHDSRAGLRVLYHPPLVELCGFSTWKLPPADMFPEPSARDLVECEGGVYESSSSSGDSD